MISGPNEKNNPLQVYANIDGTRSPDPIMPQKEKKRGKGQDSSRRYLWEACVGLEEEWGVPWLQV
jgi:hypothetical protein